MLATVLVILILIGYIFIHTKDYSDKTKTLAKAWTGFSTTIN